MSKLTILIDLDDTLINTTHQIKPKLFSALEKFGWPRTKIIQVYQKVLKTKPFSLKEFVNQLALGQRRKNRRLTRQKIEKGLLSKPRQHNFPGVNLFLKQLARRHTLILLTYGSYSWQRQKIRQAEIKRFFNRLIITTERSKKSALLKLRKRYGQTVVLLDNSPLIQKRGRALGLRVIPIYRRQENLPDYQKILNRLTLVQKQISQAASPRL